MWRFLSYSSHTTSCEAERCRTDKRLSFKVQHHSNPSTRYTAKIASLDCFAASLQTPTTSPDQRTRTGASPRGEKRLPPSQSCSALLPSLPPRRAAVGQREAAQAPPGSPALLTSPGRHARRCQAVGLRPSSTCPNGGTNAAEQQRFSRCGLGSGP